MNKQIRPLAAFKKANPEIYLKFWDLTQKDISAKGKENEFYFIYACQYLGMDRIKQTLHPDTIDLIERVKILFSEEGKSKEGIENQIDKIKRGHQHLTKTEYNSFFFNSEGEFANIGTVSELGRLLLSGWYYGVDDWTTEIGGYIYKAYKKIESEGQHFNDLDFQKAVKHIRENIIYYYQNDPKLKLYILKTFFNDKLTPLLPPAPEELKKHERALSLVMHWKKTAKSKGIDHWINKADNLELYYFYLQEILEDLGVEDFLSFEDWLKNENSKEDDYWCKIEKIQQEYNAQISNKVKTLNFKNL